MAIERVLTKQKAALEDLTLGNSTEQQTRNGNDHTVTQIGGATLPYDAAGGDSIKTKVDTAQSTANVAQSTANTAASDATAALNALPGKVDKTGATGAAALPAGTTAQRPDSPQEGYARINTDTSVLEVYTGGSWTSFGTVADLVAATLVHDMASDADYVLSAAENFYGRVVITDTGVVLTTGRNIVVSDSARLIFVKNETAQILTVKTVAGTGIAVLPGDSIGLVNDGTNVVLQTQTATPIQTNFPMIMGDANLGDVVYSSSQALGSGVYQYNDLTINAGVVLTPTETENAWWVFIVQGTFTYAGVLNMDERGSLGGTTAAADGVSGLFGGSGGEGGKIAATADGKGGDSRFLLGGAGGAFPGASGEACSSLTTSEEYLRERPGLSEAISGLHSIMIQGGAGGGAGHTGFDPFGAGGNGGGVTLVLCDTFDFQATGQFSADGENGSDAVDNAGAGGGGGGGALIVFARQVLNDAGNISVLAGTGGSSNSGSPGGDGGNGYYVLITPNSRSERTT